MKTIEELRIAYGKLGVDEDDPRDLEMTPIAVFTANAIRLAKQWEKEGREDLGAEAREFVTAIRRAVLSSGEPLKNHRELAASIKRS